MKGSSQEPVASSQNSGELIWAFDEPQTIGSIARCRGTRWGEGAPVDPTQPMYILREATGEEWEADGGCANHPGPLYFYAVSVD